MTHRYITDNTMQTRSTNDVVTPDDDNDNDNDVSNCSTPYVSAPSSPSNNHNHNQNHNQNQFRPASSSAFFFYSAPSSPMHYVARSHLNPSASHTAAAAPPSLSSPTSFDFDFEFEFEFGSSFDSPAPSADELFLNGQIRPFKLHDIISEEHDHEDDIIIRRSREDAKLCGSRSQRRRTRSMSPLRSATPFDDEASAEEKAAGEEEEAPPSGSSSRCSSAGRSSKRWVFLKDFLRSKSEGRSNNKFWHTFSSPASKEKEKEKYKTMTTTTKKNKVGTAAAGKRRSAHEMHYAANRAQAEEMRKKTFLPYRQGLLGCLGFNSKSYGALHGFARALNPVSSR